MNEPNFPIFDMRAFETADRSQRESMGTAVDTICRETGFLAITGHGIGAGIIEAVWFNARTFFALPHAEKRKSAAPYPGYPYGYLGPEMEALAKSRGVETPPDLKESFNGGPQSVPTGLSDEEALSFCYAPTIWPNVPPGFKDSWIAYYAAMEDLAARIMRLFAVALELTDDYFDRYIDAPVSALRALNYPAQSKPAREGQLRAGAHTDYGSLTILLPQAHSKGLEILSPEGKWTPVPAIPGAFIVNIGDLMARWTNDRWVSTMHRVVNPPGEGHNNEKRQSFAFFHQPNWEAEINCIASCLAPGENSKYGPVRSGPYLMAKFKATTVAEA